MDMSQYSTRIARLRTQTASNGNGLALESLIPNQLINSLDATFVAAVPAEDRAPTMASVQSKKQKKKKEKYSLSELKTMGHQLLSSRAHINNLPLLLSVVSPTSPPHYVLEAILSIQSFFTPVIRDLPSNSSKNFAHDAEDDPELIYRTWLRSKFDEFVRVLIDVLVSPESEDTLKEVVLDTVMELVKVGNRGRFHSAIYHRVLCSIVHSKFAVNMLLDLLVSKYFQFVDIRYFTYISVEKLAGMFKLDHISDERNTSLCGNDDSHSSDGIELIHKLHYIISHIPPPESLDEKSHCSMWSESGFTLGSESKEVSETLKADHATEKHTTEMLSVSKIGRKMKLKFSKAWISFLKLPLPVEVYKEVLVSLPQSVIPHLSKPVILCDFLTKSYDIGGVVSVMALSSLYVLMMQYGLEYPNFYEKLYALLVPSVFMAKHRARFFELLDSCLKSPLLPAYLAAAFAKKLSRLSLSASPSGALVIIVLIHNLLRRHPSINCLVHQEVVQETVRDDSAEEETVASRVDDSGSNSDTSSWRAGVDYFISDESDPMKSRAMKSSLWEVDTLRHHHCPPVSRFVLSLEKDLTVRAKTTEIDVKDFCSGSYTTIFGEEMRKRVKQVPLAFYKTTPTTLFSESDFPGWSFKYEGSLVNNNSNNIDKVVEKPEKNAEISAKRQRVECS